MSLKLYCDLLSQPSRAVYIFIKTCNIPCAINLIQLKNLEHHTPEFEAINPFKKVPVIDHNGFKLTESVGILRYICREFNVPDHWYPTDSKAQAKVDEYLEWQHLNTRLFCAEYFLVKVLRPLMGTKPATPEKLKQYETRMSDCLDQIENIWLKNKSFITGDNITIADILAACEIEQPRMAGYEPRKGRPRLTAWLERVVKATTPHYEEAHKVLNKIADKRQSKL